jgi:hypothetical protein
MRSNDEALQAILDAIDDLDDVEPEPDHDFRNPKSAFDTYLHA